MIEALKVIVFTSLFALPAAAHASAAAGFSWVLADAPSPIADVASLAGWKDWFLSEPGGPKDGSTFAGPGNWREFPTPTRLRRLWGAQGFSELVKGRDGIERIAYTHEGRLYLAQRAGTEAGAAWRHEFVAETGLEWNSVSLGVAYDRRVHVVYENWQSSGRRWVHAVREPFGMWTRDSLPLADGASRVVFTLDASANPHLLFVHEGRVGHLWNEGAGWRNEAPTDAEIAEGEFQAVARAHDGSLWAAWVGPGGRLKFGGRGPSGWSMATVARAAAQPQFVAGPGGGLAISFQNTRTGSWQLAERYYPVPLGTPLEPEPRTLPSPWVPLALLLLGRAFVVARRASARKTLRAEAALLGGVGRIEVVARDVRANAWSPLKPGLISMTSRSPVLWIQGLKPGEAWLGEGWSVAPGRPGWVELRCGPVALEVAPEPGFKPWGSAKGADSLLEALRAARAFARGRQEGASNLV